MTDRLEFFDSWAEQYEESLEDAAGFPFEGYRSNLEQVLALANPAAGSAVVDFGAGTGALASLFLERDCRVTGVDFSAEMLSLAQARFPAAVWLHADLLAGWPEALSDRQFDLAVSAYVFHEYGTASKLKLIDNVFKTTLKPGGRLLIADIAFADQAALEQAHSVWKGQWDDAEHYWVVADMLAELQTVGVEAEFMPVSFCAGVFNLSQPRVRV